MPNSENLRPRRMGFKVSFLLLPFFVFFLFGGFLAQAADNAACLKCHKNPRLSKGKKDGSLLSLYVNEEAFKVSVHGAAGMGCTDCHQEAKPEFHPAEGFPEIGCASCHQDQVEAYKKTTHGMVWESGIERAPKCQDCHTSHYMRKSNDPQSPLQLSRLGKVCAQCHEEAKPPSGLLTTLATYRLMGHPKTDLGARYSTETCANCHPENTGHPQKPGLAPSCVKCHDRSFSTPLLLGPIHFKMSFSEQPIPFFLRILYGVGIVMVIVCGLGYFSYQWFRRKKTKKEEAGKETSQATENKE